MGLLLGPLLFTLSGLEINKPTYILQVLLLRRKMKMGNKSKQIHFYFKGFMMLIRNS